MARSLELHQYSTENTKEYIIDGKKTGLIGFDESVTWRAKHFGIWQNLTSKITEYNRPYVLTDEMVKGAFKSFKHKHEFKEQNNCTIMHDTFDFESPLGILGKVFNRIILIRYMTVFLNDRNLIIKEYAESHKWKKFL